MKELSEEVKRLNAKMMEAIKSDRLVMENEDLCLESLKVIELTQEDLIDILPKDQFPEVSTDNVDALDSFTNFKLFVPYCLLYHSTAKELPLFLCQYPLEKINENNDSEQKNTDQYEANLSLVMLYCILLSKRITNTFILSDIHNLICSAIQSISDSKAFHSDLIAWLLSTDQSVLTVPGILKSALSSSYLPASFMPPGITHYISLDDTHIHTHRLACICTHIHTRAGDMLRCTTDVKTRLVDAVIMRFGYSQCDDDRKLIENVMDCLVEHDKPEMVRVFGKLANGKGLDVKCGLSEYRKFVGSLGIERIFGDDGFDGHADKIVSEIIGPLVEELAWLKIDSALDLILQTCSFLHNVFKLVKSQKDNFNRLHSKLIPLEKVISTLQLKFICEISDSSTLSADEKDLARLTLTLTFIN